MKLGKIQENVLRRSVLKHISGRRDDIFLRPGIGENCAAVCAEPKGLFVFSSSIAAVPKVEKSHFAVNTAVNYLAAQGAEPVGIMVDIILQERTREKFLRILIESLEESCKLLGIDLIKCDSEVSALVNCPVLTVTGIGKSDKGKFMPAAGLNIGDEIVMTKWAGIEATAVLAADRREVLSKTLPDELLDIALGMRDSVSVVTEALAAASAGAKAMYSLSQGGVFGALWEFGAASDAGLTVDLQKIPIRQETIEVCEVFDLNPYKMLSGGSLLIGCINGNRMVEALADAGVSSAVIGYVTDSNDRIVVNGDESRFLEPADSDETYKIL